MIFSKKKIIIAYTIEKCSKCGMQRKREFIDGDCLFITEGEYGLKMYDISNLNEIELTEHFKDISSIDVIPFMGILMMIGNDGFHQYSYDCDLGEIDYISTIPINRL